ncbi:MAG: aminodeoxychorismate/anthranilate synthase component II [Chitinophagaceae bacterium]|nr:aminodeoxychorismate/anthranilate synthase component II [Chitinophagaceae bacterium]MCW5905335.1 aminodeoxychorismate/anthranilate synthase component II [Chitinophagaceae bacterium]
MNSLLKENIGTNTFNKKILLLDNYDSFTYNLVHLVEKITNHQPTVFLNDKIDLNTVNDYDKIILSPGPGIPEEAGLLLSLIKQYASAKSILGVCLGHQAIAVAFGGSLINLPNVYHGVSMKMMLKSNTHSYLFNHLPNEIEVGRYHSWVVDENNLPNTLEATAVDENGYIMALQHRLYDVQGVQFHPESILTPLGETILRNWLLK